MQIIFIEFVNYYENFLIVKDINNRSKLFVLVIFDVTVENT